MTQAALMPRIEPDRRVVELRDRWIDLIESCGAPRIFATRSFSIMEREYARSGRLYHGLSHVADALHVCDLLRPETVSWRNLEFAIWFHDWVFQPGVLAAWNERASARAASAFLTELGVSGREINEVKALILCTRKHLPLGRLPDSRIMCDADLAILGSTWQRYWRYACDLRQEYQGVPAWIYAPLRKRRLRMFLERPAIYHTASFRRSHEHRARRNLIRELDIWRSLRRAC